jgi:hypothetical protein
MDEFRLNPNLSELLDEYEDLLGPDEHKKYKPKTRRYVGQEVKPGQKMFATLEYPGFIRPFEVIEGNPLDRKCKEITIREMDIEIMMTEMTIKEVSPNPGNPAIKAIRMEGLFKSSYGLHRITATPLAKDF